MQGPEVRDPEKDLATAITLQVQLDNGKHMVLQTYISRDASMARYHGVADKLYRVVERQQWKADLLNLKAAIDVDERGLQAQIADFNRIDDKNRLDWENRGKKGDPKLSQAEASAKMNAGTNIKRFKEELEKKRKFLAELEAKLEKETVES